MRSAFLSVLILAAAAMISFGTLAQSNPSPLASRAPTQSIAQAVSQPIPQQGSVASNAAQAAPATPAKPASPGMVTVVLDPAHGAPDFGARGPTGVTESDVVLDFARAIRVSLESQGFRVLLTRDGNQDPSFDDRSAMANGLRDVVFVSLHVSSTGPIGTVRAYSYVFPAGGPASETFAVPTSNQSSDQASSQAPAQTGASGPAASAAPVHPGLIQWDQAQRAYLSSSQQLASLVQIQLAQKFSGSPELPLVATVHQLRSIAAPAIAVEVSCVAVTDPQQLARMGQPLADAVSRALVDFRSSGNAATNSSGGSR